MEYITPLINHTNSLLEQGVVCELQYLYNPQNRINNQHFQRMKSNAYVQIDAHIIRCRLHHQNNLKYSVALKSGKQQEVYTDFKPSKDLIIEMDTHLSLHADKYSFDNFPKLTLIVNVMGESSEKKSVGTTFANFKKEGVQVFQVSECSCKDKAFQVEILFTLKMVQAKSSKPSNNKNQIGQDKKTNYFSHQPTPRESRQIKLQRLSKPLKDNIKTESEQKFNRYNSQKLILAIPKQQIKQTIEKQNIRQSWEKQIEQLSDKLKIQQSQLKNLSIELQQYRQNNSLLKQLLTLQQQKSNEAIKHLSYLQTLIFSEQIKDRPLVSSGCITSFKVIQQKDQFIEINEQLQGQLEIQRQANNMLYLQIDQLKRQLHQIKEKYQEKIKISEISLYSAKNEVALQTQYQIPIISVCNSNKGECEVCKQQNQLPKKFEQKITVLKAQIQRLQVVNKQLQQQVAKLKPTSFNKKKSPARPQILKKEEVRKTQKGTSSDKNWKPPKQMPKKGTQSPTSNIQITSKKSIGANSTNSVDLKQKPTKIASTQVQTKTERQESLEDFQSNQQSVKKSQVYNQIIYFTDGLDN